MTVEVVTSENLAQFNARKLGLVVPEPAAAPASAEPAKDKGEPAVESAANESGDGAGAEATEQLDKISDPAAKQKIHVRFSELTEQRKAAEAAKAKAEEEAKAARERAELAERAAAELRTKYERPKVEGPGPKPERAQFNDDAEHVQALEHWAREDAIYQRDKQDAAARVEAKWNERQAAVRAEIPSYDADLATGGNLMVSNAVRDAIIESDQGPKILHHLSKNPAFVEELAKVGDAGALRRIGRLEAKFEAEKPATAPAAEVKTEPAKPAAAATEISRAPAPITPLKTSNDSSGGTQVDSKGEFHGTFDQWKAARKAGLIK